ncbi:MAG: acyl--CoA ligase [Oscillospiraceae bacterium]|nr:acyl--CoA ligase [Oscillospiraceae bacterium]
MKPVNRTLHSFLTEYACRQPDRRLLGGPEGWLTAAQTLDRVELLAERLGRDGIHRGDFVALRAVRCVDTALWLLTLQCIGAVAVLTDPRREIRDFLSGLELSLPVSALVEGDCMTVLTPSAPEEGEVDPKAPGFLIFTSGSTGKPKAVMLSQYNLVNNLVDSQPLGCYHPEDIALGALPLEHVFGLVLLAGVCVLGYGIYFPESTGLEHLLSCIENQKITRMNGVPSLYLAMAEQAERYDLSSLRAGFIGGGPYTPEQFCRIEEVLGITLIPVYGMSECIGIACGNWQDSQALRARGVGRIYSMNTCKILLPDGSEASTGQTGEIHVTGPARMVGYYPDRMAPEELLPTGDLGALDGQGLLCITGRKKDIIIRNGVNIAPQPIEDALRSIPGVKEACVVGLPHALQGEVPWALVVGTRTATELFAILSGLLPKNQLPLEIILGEQMPMTGSGKPDKMAVREVLKKWIL